MAQYFAGKILRTWELGAFAYRVFYLLLANIFVSMELGEIDMAGRPQNLERQRVICNILLDNELDDTAALHFPVSGMDCSYCLGLNTM